MTLWLLRHAAVWGVGAVVLRAAVVPAEVCPAAPPARVRGAVAEAAAWLERGQRADGRFVYAYDRERDLVSAEYNHTRHAGVLYALYAAGRAEAADRGLEYVLDRLVDHHGWTAFAPPGETASAGANGLLLAALVYRRAATGDTGYDPLVRRIARFLLAQQEPDGSVLKDWSPDTGQAVPGVHGKWSTGEAFWALALAHRLFPADGFDRAAHRTARYLATRRDEAEGYTVRLPDHWAAYGLAELAPTGLTAVEVAYARRLAGYFGTMTRVEAQLEGGTIVRWLYGGTNSASGLGTIGEATAALRRLSRVEPRLSDVRDDLDDRLSCVAGILVERQVSASEARADPRPALARGAWFDEGSTRMDDQQHAISALLGALEARAG